MSQNRKTLAPGGALGLSGKKILRSLHELKNAKVMQQKPLGPETASLASDQPIPRLWGIVFRQGIEGQPA